MKLTKSKLTQIIREELAIAFNEAVDPTYIQRYYSVTLSASIDRKMGGEREETLREIRAIPKVTTVSVVPGTVAKFANKYRMDLDLKFVLLGTESLKKYQITTLKPGLQSIKGLNILNVGHPAEI